MLHIGENIRWLIDFRKLKVRDLAKHLEYSEQAVHAIFKKESIDALLLKDIAGFFNEPVWMFYEEHMEGLIKNRQVNELAEEYKKEPDELKRLRDENRMLNELLRHREETIASLQRRV